MTDESNQTEFEKIILKRFTCRTYKDQTFDIEIVKEIAEKALFAPSADNRQAFRFFLLEKKNYFKVRRLISQGNSHSRT